MSVPAQWMLTSSNGRVNYPLPDTMEYVNRSLLGSRDNNECLQPEERHALISFDPHQSKYQVKDLGTAEGTYINDRRIPDQIPITIEGGDMVRLGKDSEPLLVERCVTSNTTTTSTTRPTTATVASRITSTGVLPQSHSLDRINTSSATPSNLSSGEDSSHSISTKTPLSRSSSRPTWERRLHMAECQGCILEQDLLHSCGANAELFSAEDIYTHSTPEANSRSNPVSPVHMLAQTRTPSKEDVVDYRTQIGNAALQPPGLYYREELMPLTHARSSAVEPSSEERITPHQNARIDDVINVATKRGTPLYGQPTWWGETDADEHNKRLLQDIQKQKEQHQKTAEEDRKLLNSVASKHNTHSQSQSGEASGDTSQGLVATDGSKSLSFTVDLEDSLEEKNLRVEPLTSTSSGEKLSNFLPENLRKSFRERRERFSQSNDRSQNEKSSPGLNRRSKSPNRIASSSHHQSSSRETTTMLKYNNHPDNPSSFLINKLLCNIPSSDAKYDSDTREPGDAMDEQTEYALYTEAKSLNRSSTMPELVHSQGAAKHSITKSRTLDSVTDVDNGDKVSESGTYTIDEDNKELEQAREDIEVIFGIRQRSPSSPIGPSCLEITESTDNLMDVNSSLQVEIGSSKTDDTYTSSAALLSTHSKDKETISSSPSRRSAHHQGSPAFDSSNDVIVGKPPISPTFRSRSPEGHRDSPPRSSGRRLPAVPCSGKRDSSPEVRHSTEVSIGRSNTMPRRKKEVEYSKEKILQELGIGDTPVIEKERPRLVEELLTSRTYHKDNDPIVVNKTTFYDKIISSAALLSPEQSKELPQCSANGVSGGSSRQSRVGGSSVDTVNTDVLLQSTDEFMKAIHSFSDSSQVSNGKPATGKTIKSTNRQSNSLRQSTADRLSSNKSGSGGGPEIPTPRGTTSNKDTSTIRRSVSDSVTARLTSNRKSHSTSREPDNNGGSVESLNNSKNATSAGKVGPLSSSRPNRTFELRRARTESMESENSTATTPRTNGSRTAGRSARSLDNSEVSLGARIVQKSRENGAVMDQPKTAQPLRRSDGGRYSMRATSSTNKNTTIKTTVYSGTSKPTTTTKKMTPRTTSGNSLIAKAEREKEAGKEREKAAWDRRRTYDPRRAVQEKGLPKGNTGRKNVKSYPQCSPLQRDQSRKKLAPAFEVKLPKVQAKAKKSDSSRGGTPSSSNDEFSTVSSSRPRANSYSGGDNASNVDTTPTSNYNETSDSRHSADVFLPMESDSLKLNLNKEDDIEDSSHELEIAQLSHNIAEGLEMLYKDAGGEEKKPIDRFRKKMTSNKEKIDDQSPETEELIDSMFACQQQNKSAFSSYRSAASVTPELSSPALSPMRKKLSSSQNLANGSPSALDHSYNNLVLTSIQRLSAKLHNYTSNTVGRLRDNGVSVSTSPSPTDELQCDDMPANSTLASILKTLKNVEQNCKVMDKALFTSSVPQSDLSTVSNNEHEHYLAEIKRIRNEIAGFRPIESIDSKTAPTSKTTSKSLNTSNNNNNSNSMVTKSRTTNSNTAKIGSSAYKQRSVYY